MKKKEMEKDKLTLIMGVQSFKEDQNQHDSSAQVTNSHKIIGIQVCSPVSC